MSSCAMPCAHALLNMPLAPACPPCPMSFKPACPPVCGRRCAHPSSDRPCATGRMSSWAMPCAHALLDMPLAHACTPCPMSFKPACTPVYGTRCAHPSSDLLCAMRGAPSCGVLCAQALLDVPRDPTSPCDMSLHPSYAAAWCAVLLGRPSTLESPLCARAPALPFGGPCAPM
eukprot:366494-Chlamydomonas_euryale.AAC.5